MYRATAAALLGCYLAAVTISAALRFSIPGELGWLVAGSGDLRPVSPAFEAPQRLRLGGASFR